MNTKITFLILLIIGLHTGSQAQAFLRETVKDASRNTYQIVAIGSQLWMAENLSTERFNDRSRITVHNDNRSWANQNGPAMAWLLNDKRKYSRNGYGALYNYDAVATGNLCPAGWRVASLEDYQILIDFLGGRSSAGGKMKQAGNETWLVNMFANNQSGFTALPGGRRNLEGEFQSMFIGAYFWTSTSGNNSNEAWAVRLQGSNGTVQLIENNHHNMGLSVRCVAERNWLIE